MWDVIINEMFDIKMDNLPITKILLMFYLLIGNSLLQPLLSKQWITTVKNDRIIQHLIGFTTMLTLAILISNESEDYVNIIMCSIIGYIWFIFSTKMDIHFNMMIIVLLIASYLYDNSLKTQNKKILSDKILTDDQKQDIIINNNIKSKCVMFGMMALIVGGMIMYSNKKEGQYGGGFSLVNFLLY